MKRHVESKGHLLKGLLLLLLGSILLLCCKLSLPLWLDSFLVFIGAGILLYGNGQILYGLLVHADDRTYASDFSSSSAPQDGASRIPETVVPERQNMETSADGLK